MHSRQVLASIEPIERSVPVRVQVLLTLYRVNPKALKRVFISADKAQDEVEASEA